MTTPRYTGHPDWIPTNSTPIPVLIAEEGPLAFGTWGPITLDFTSGGAYLLAVTATTPANCLLTDITVQHYDVAGNLVATDFYGAVFNGAAFGDVLSVQTPTLVRGNVYGPTLKISGQVATTAQVNAIMSQTTLTASDATINIYALPNGLGDPDPHLSCGGAEIGAFTGTAPGQLLFSIVNGSIGPGVSSAVTPLAPYSGPAVLTIEDVGVTTTPTNVFTAINFWTVANGDNSICQIVFRQSAALVGFAYDLDLPACLATIQVSNLDGAQTATVRAAIIGARTA